MIGAKRRLPPISALAIAQRHPRDGLFAAPALKRFSRH
jgi:hypothetical protein